MAEHVGRTAGEEDFNAIVRRIAVKYAKLVEERIDAVQNGLTQMHWRFR